MMRVIFLFSIFILLLALFFSQGGLSPDSGSVEDGGEEIISVTPPDSSSPQPGNQPSLGSPSPGAGIQPPGSSGSGQAKHLTEAKKQIMDLVNKMSSSTCTASVNLSYLYSTAALAVFAFFLLSLLIYLAGYLLNSPEISAIGKEEMLQNLMTAVRILLIFLVFTGSNYSFWILAKTPGSNAYTYAIDKAMAFSVSIVESISVELSTLLIFNSVIYSFYASTVFVGFGKSSFSFSPGPILRPVVDLTNMMIQFLSLSLGEWIFSFSILCTIKKYAFSIFLPVGVILRAIPPFRQAGDAVFALFLAFVFILPVMLVIDSAVHDILKHEILDMESMVERLFGKIDLSGFALFFIIFSMLTNSFLLPFLIGGVTRLLISFLQNAAYYIFLMSFILPFINVFVTLTAAKEFTKIFGTEVNFLGFLRLI